jgi:hypothetical protein
MERLWYDATHYKTKVKLSLCLNKYHTMKTCPVLYYTPCHEDKESRNPVYEKHLIILQNVTY